MERRDFSLFYSSPLGWLKLNSDEFSLKSIRFVDAVEDSGPLPVPGILDKALVQLCEYFDGKRFSFNLELDPEGTCFQKQVWELVQSVEFGKTKSYGNLAIELGSAKLSRAVGMANGKNPLPLIIPCHRIIGENGKLTGYSGGLERKKWLLLHEQKWSGKVLF